MYSFPLFFARLPIVRHILGFPTQFVVFDIFISFGYFTKDPLCDGNFPDGDPFILGRLQR
jgi:hypothetical protein